MQDELRQLLAFAEAQDARLCAFELDCVCQQFSYDASAENLWVPFPQPTRVYVLIDAREANGGQRRFRAEYDPQVVRWFADGAARTSNDPSRRGFVVRTHTEIGDGRQTTSYAKERRWRATVYLRPTDIYLTGERFLLCRFGRREFAGQIGPVESEPMRLARAILEPERFDARGIVEARTADWESTPHGRRVLRLEQVFTRGGRHVYHLDPERAYALIRFAEAAADEEPESVFEVAEFSQVADGFWFPARVSSRMLNPGPSVTSPVQIDARHRPVNLPPGVSAEGAVRWVTSQRVPLPEGDQPRCEYEFSNVRVAIDVPPDAFEFHPPVP